jgi:Fe-S cluster assembly scaffold protein SufB
MKQVVSLLKPKPEKIAIDLDRDGQEAELLVAFVGKDKEEYLLAAQVFHQALHTQSYTMVRGVLFDQAKAKVDGLIKIDKGAQHTNAFLEEKILLIGNRAQADAQPQLEIEANEVKASHAATVGTIDEEQLFYLMSRGLSRVQAVQQIVLGFLQPVLDRIKNKAVRSKIKQNLTKRLRS